MKRVLVVGGANGIGLSIVKSLTSRTDIEKVYIVDKAVLEDEYQEAKIESFQFDLTNSDYSLFDRFSDVDAIMITAGFGVLNLFKDIDEKMISLYFTVNTVAVIRIVKHFYERLLSEDDFYFGIMGSISGFMASPFFSLYGSTKAALKIFIESVNVELIKSGSKNRILNVAPGSIKGTRFANGENDLSLTKELAMQIINHLEAKDDLFIPDYDSVFHNVLERYHKDFRAEGLHSYEYKLASGRIKTGKK